jgi:hypothetical protein
VEKLKVLHLDVAEVSCLKAILLFTTGQAASYKLQLYRLQAFIPWFFDVEPLRNIKFFETRDQIHTSTVQ